VTREKFCQIFVVDISVCRKSLSKDEDKGFTFSSLSISKHFQEGNIFGGSLMFHEGKREMGFWRKLRQWASAVDAISNPSVTFQQQKKEILTTKLFEQMKIFNINHVKK